MPPRRSTRGGGKGESQESSDTMRLIQGSIDVLATAITTRLPGGSSGSGNSKRGASFEQFRKMHPPTFAGGNVPEKAKSWLPELEKFFGVLDTPKEEKVKLAAFQLTDNVSVWFEGVSQREAQPMS